MDINWSGVEVDRLVYNLHGLEEDEIGACGENNMSEIVVTSVAEFQARLQELESDEAGLLYRGQADAVLAGQLFGGSTIDPRPYQSE